MKKKLFLLPLALGLAIGVASCGEEQTPTEDDNKVVEDNTSQTDEKTPSYTIKVYDIDDALLGEKTLKISDYPKLLDGLVKNFDVKYSTTSYGTYLTQINNSILDSNYYLSILENGSFAQVGVDDLEVNDGDVFEFKSDCMNTIAWGGTFDDYDILVDKIIYHYAKGKLKNNIKSATTYLGSTFWDQCMVNLALSSGYDAHAFDVKDLYTDAFKATVSSADVTNLAAATEYPTDANIAKWYYSARAIGYSTDAFITSYTSYLEGLTEYSENGEYVLPFTLSIAKGLNLDSKINQAIFDTTYRAGTTYGIDGISWQLAGLAQYKALEATELDVLTLDTINNSVENFGCMKDVSLATILIPYAAMGVDARGFKIENDKDVLAYLLDNCFDKETYQFDVEKTAGDRSSNQIYASLMAYKVRRDTKKAAYLFA